MTIPVTANRRVHYEADSGITLVGSKVSQWDDQSGNASHLLQAVDGSRPTYVAAGSEGKPRPYLYFNGSNFLKASVADLDPPFTCFAVAAHGPIPRGQPISVARQAIFDWTVLSTNQGVLLFSGSPTDFGVPVTYDGGRPRIGLRYRDASTNRTAHTFHDFTEVGESFGENYIYTGRASDSGGNGVLHLSRDQEAVVTANFTGHNANNCVNLVVGGLGSGTTFPWTGYMHAIVIYDVYLSDADVALVRNYLYEKWVKLANFGSIYHNYYDNQAYGRSSGRANAGRTIRDA